MTNIRYFTMFLLAMLMVLGAWQGPRSKGGIVKLKIEAGTQLGADTRIIDYSRITGNKLGGIRLDAQGKGSFSFELGSARFLSIEIGELSEEVKEAIMPTTPILEE